MILNRDASDRKITGYRIFGIRSDIRKGKLDIRHFPGISGASLILNINIYYYKSMKVTQIIQNVIQF